MGGKESKFSFITHEEATKRIQEHDENEVSRLKDSYKRYPVVHGLMLKTTFFRDVIGDGVPITLAEKLYSCLGGTSRGISSKDLICAIAIIYYGSKEERIRFLFSLFALENNNFIQKEDMDSLVMTTDGCCSSDLSLLFKHEDRVTFDDFSFWQRNHPGATSISRWLLETPPSPFSSYRFANTPTFYQTLAGVTHLTEEEVVELEKRYWVLKSQSQSGRFDLDTIKPYLAPPVPNEVCQGLFNAFDENRDNHIDFKEMACGVSACCRGPDLERQRFCFKVFDSDHNGLLGREELLKMIEAMVKIRSENLPSHCKISEVIPEVLIDQILNEFDGDKDGYITHDEYLLWTNSEENELPKYFLELLFQICHISLGLRPQNTMEEKQIIIGWKNREDRRGLQCAQVIYLINSTWWEQWENYVNSNIPKCQTISPDFDNKVLNRTQTTFKSKRNYSLDDDSLVTGKSYKSMNGRDYSTLSPPMSKRHAMKPAAIDNSIIVQNPIIKVSTLTNEGGLLKPNLSKNDFVVLGEHVWKALHSWYNGQPALPRSVIIERNQPVVELYPITVKLFKHQTNLTRPLQGNSLSGVVGSLSGAALNELRNAGLITSHVPPQPKRVLMNTASFSRHHTIRQILDFLSGRLRISKEDIRLWKYQDELQQNLALLDDEDKTVLDSNIINGMELLIEIRSKDLTWPEEMFQLARRKTLEDKKELIQAEKGATGLNNLGNTCFLNSAVQCISNTKILTEYFTSSKHLYELNKNNRFGMKGHIANSYGELIQSLWSGTNKTVAPLKLKYTIGRYAPRFNNFQQQDSQELLSFLMDGLNEDLNRNHEKPYTELKDSNGRPDIEVADEAWENHILRNRSIIVDLFHGMLKSCVKCLECENASVRFDPFTFLSLPLPMESCLHLEILVIKCDGSVPIRYGLRLDNEEKYGMLKNELSKLSNIPVEELLLVEIFNGCVKSFPHDRDRVVAFSGALLYSYEIPIMPLQIQIPNGLKPSDSISIASSSSSINNSRLIIAIHRKMIRQDVYILCHSKNRPNVFGTPLILDYNDKLTNRQLYENIMKQMSRLVCSEQNHSFLNHALNGDDANEYPFILKTVNKDATICSKCEWHKFCKGCEIICDDRAFVFTTATTLSQTEPAILNVAIDWEATALHLRYQSSQEKAYIDDSSVSEVRKAQTEPINLDACLKAFTRQEKLDKEDGWNCSKCKKQSAAVKTLQLWSLPPILIVHLKRFISVNGASGKYVKSHKIVNFPLDNFDPWQYAVQDRNGDLNNSKCRRRLESTTSQHNPKYKLYALSCHSGMITGGHYVTYAKNPNGKWYFYNDSSCKEVNENLIDKNMAYMLFYERENLNSQQFMPDISNKKRQSVDEDEIDESLKKCRIM